MHDATSKLSPDVQSVSLLHCVGEELGAVVGVEEGEREGIEDGLGVSDIDDGRVEGDGDGTDTGELDGRAANWNSYHKNPKESKRKLV